MTHPKAHGKSNQLPKMIHWAKKDNITLTTRKLVICKEILAREKTSLAKF